VHGASADGQLMVMVNKLAAGRNQAVISNLNALTDIKLTAPANENAVPRNNRRSRLPKSIVLKEDVAFQNATLPYSYLMRPSDQEVRNAGACPKPCSLQLPPKLSQSGLNAKLVAKPKPSFLH